MHGDEWIKRTNHIYSNSPNVIIYLFIYLFIYYLFIYLLYFNEGEKGTFMGKVSHLHD